jgi:hypothetical protein
MDAENSRALDAQQRIIATAEKKLRRPLTTSEQRAIRGLEQSTVVFEVASWSGEQVLDLLRSIVGSASTATLLEVLAASPGSLPELRQKMLNSFPARTRRILEPLDLQQALDSLSRWLLDLARGEPPSKQIHALNFGLFESERRCKLYISGSKKYDRENDDWATVRDWWPEGRYAPSEDLFDFWPAIRRARGEPWVAAQAVVIILVKAFFAAHDAEFRELSGLKDLYVTSGFDEGDLYAVQTAVSPAKLAAEQARR